MAWTLCEELLKAWVVYAVGWMVARTWRLVVEVRICTIKDCGGVASKRGLCLKCYSCAKKMVEDGGATWKDLEAMGMCEVEETPFERAFEQAKNPPKRG